MRLDAGAPGIDSLLFAVVGEPACTLPVVRLADEYRRRFGIEASYRQLHQARARTTSREPGLRLPLVTVACLLTNLWAYCKARLVASDPTTLRSAARRWVDTCFRLDTFTALLVEGVKTRYRAHAALIHPYLFPTLLEL